MPSMTVLSNRKEPLLNELNGRLRVGVIGLGEVATLRHLPALKNDARYEIGAVADVDAARLRQVAEQYGLERAYQDGRALIAQPELDAIAICTPPATHAALVHAALDANKHVLVEKPLTLDAAEAQSVAEHAERARTKVLVGFNLRHHTHVQRAKAWLRAGRIGKIRAVHTMLTNVRTHDTGTEWRRDVDRGGDLIFELGVHHFDLCRYLCEGDIVEMHAQRTVSPQGQMTVTAQARLSNEVLATSMLAQDTLEHNSIELIGERGRMIVSMYRFDGPILYPRGTYDGGFGLRLQHTREMVQALPRAMSEQRKGGAYVLTYPAEWEHFYQVVRHNAAPLAGVRDGVAATRAANLARASLNHSSFISSPVRADAHSSGG